MNRLFVIALSVLVSTSAGCDSGGGGKTDTVADTSASDSTPADTAPADTDTASTPLMVVSTVPADGQVASPASPIVVRFNQPIERVSVNDNTVAVMAGDTRVGGTHEVDGADYTFTPTEFLANDTVHTVSLSTGIRAAAGGPTLGAPVDFSFRTSTALKVVSVEPLDGAEKVATSTAVRVVFDRPIVRSSVTEQTFQVVTTGWVEGVYYDDAPLPGSVRVLDEGVTLQWSVKTQALPEYEVRHDVIVTRGVVGVDGAVLDEPFRSSFETQLLSSDFYYQVRVDGLGETKALGLDNSGNVPLVTELTVADAFDWYVLYLNDNRSVGVWNRGANKALRDNRTQFATVEPWQGIVEQAFRLERYGGTNGRDGVNVSPFDYVLKSKAGADDECMRAEISTGGTYALISRPQCGNVHSHWYFVRGPRK